MKLKDACSLEGFPGSSTGKEPFCNARDPGSISGSGRSSGEGIVYRLQYSWASLVAQTRYLGSIPGLRRSPREGIGYQLQYSGLENFMDRGAWQATVNGIVKNQTWLSNFHIHITLLLGRKAMTNLDSIIKSGDITLLAKAHITKAIVFQ